MKYVIFSSLKIGRTRGINPDFGKIETKDSKILGLGNSRLKIEGERGPSKLRIADFPGLCVASPKKQSILNNLCAFYIFQESRILRGHLRVHPAR